MKQYIKLSQYAKLKSVTYTTAWNHFNANKIEGAYKDSSGSIFVPTQNEINYKNCAVYARVSSNEMKDNLVRQKERVEEFANSNGYDIICSYKEIASGMNDNRKQLNKILDRDDWNTLIVENKDRLTRFGFNYIKKLLEKNNKKIVLLNETNNKKEDLMVDLISIIYSFSARMYGLRRKKKKEDIKKFIES